MPLLSLGGGAPVRPPGPPSKYAPVHGQISTARGIFRAQIESHINRKLYDRAHQWIYTVESYQIGVLTTNGDEMFSSIIINRAVGNEIG